MTYRLAFKLSEWSKQGNLAAWRMKGTQRRAKSNLSSSGLDDAIIPKGTIVFHGTTLQHLPAILKDGLKRSSPIHSNYAPPPAVYVGSIRKALTHASQPAMIQKNPSPSGELPLVIEIEFLERKEICIDHDYFLNGKGVLTGLMEDIDWDKRDAFYEALHLDKHLASISWSKFGSAGVLADIPTSWIRAIYAPCVKADGHIDEIDIKHMALSQIASGAKLVPADEDKPLLWPEQVQWAALKHNLSMSHEKNPLDGWRLLSGDVDCNGHSFSAQRFRQAAEKYLMQGFVHLPFLMERAVEANGDQLGLDYLCLKDCHRRANVDLSPTFANIKNNYPLRT